MISKTSNYSFKENLSFDNLSLLLNDLSIMTHPMTKEQKVCIEFPNINMENKNLNIFPEEVNYNQFLNEEFTLNISKTEKYIINPKNLFDEFNNKNPYVFEDFKNSLKIFVSIFNCFNEDLFRWNLSDFNLFNDKNIIQILEFNKEKKNKKRINSEDFMKELYQKHFSVKYDFQKNEIIEIAGDYKEENNLDDFEKGFSESKSLKNENNNLNNSELFCYEKDNVFRNIFFLMNLFNLMNKFYISEYNLDTILRNINKFNSYIINDYNILLLIFFHLAIQINLYIKKSSIDNFLDIKTSENSNNRNNTKEKIINNYFPNIFFIDYQGKEISKDENQAKKEKIILLNIILKLFNISYISNLNTNLKINIKIFNISYFTDVKSKLIVKENYFLDSDNINYISNFIQNTKFVELFNNDFQNYFSIIIFEFILLSNIDNETLNNLVEIYYPIIINSDFVSFDTLENEIMIQYPLNNYLSEINILSWALKSILKIEKANKKSKFAFTFVFNSFSIALKKDVNNKNNINIKDLMIYMGIYHYDENEMVNYIGEETNYYALYKKYKEILGYCTEYKNYNINIRLFKNGIYNKELQYHFISLILNILNNIKIKNKNFYKNISLYESKFINTFKCIFIKIKKLNQIEEKTNKMKNNELNHRANAIFSPKKPRNNNKNKNIFGKINIFKNKKDKNKINNIYVFEDNENLESNSKQKNMSNKIKNFYKNLTNCSFLTKIESDILIEFFESIKNYFTDFMFYIEKINLQKNNSNISNFIFENTFDSSLSFDPINILRNFNNNKCFIILKEFSYIDLYIYLFDFYENNFEEEKYTQKSKIEIYNDIFDNINNLKEQCYENFIDRKNTKSSIVLGKLNFIIHKSFLICNQYFEGNKIFFNNDNKIIILDKFTNTDCILDNGHIEIILNNINGNYNDKDKDGINEEDNYFLKFYTAFLYEYDIIKYITDKKLFKVNKLNIIIKRKILQINNGKIQLKKINLKKKHNKLNLNEEKIIGDNNEHGENSTPKKNNNSNEKTNNNTKQLFNENYNLFKIRELFRYENSYPLIIFFLQNHVEISNFSFLLYSFAEIFLNKSHQELKKELLIKRIIKFFYRFKNSEFIPIIFGKKYFKYFLDFFKELTSKSPAKNSTDISASSLSSKKSINANKKIFSNIIYYPINNNDLFNSDELNFFLNKDILNNLTKTISIYQLENINDINYNINQIGKMFKINRIKDTLIDLEKISKANYFEGNKNIIVYKISFNYIKKLIKKNQKKVKFVGIDEEDRTLNVHIFNSEDSLMKYKLENYYNDVNCIVF